MIGQIILIWVILWFLIFYRSINEDTLIMKVILAILAMSLLSALIILLALFIQFVIYLW